MGILQGSIAQQLRLTSLVSMGFVLIVGAVGYGAAERLMDQNERLAVNASAVRLHMQADMMHDALRSDVLASLIAAEEQVDAARQNEIKAELQEHVETFAESLKELGQLPLRSEVKAGVARADPALRNYAEKAQEIHALAFKDLTAAKQARHGFDEAFKRLEDEMEALGDVIENTAQAELQAIARTAQITRWLLVGTALLAGVLLYLVANGMGQRVARPVRHAARVASSVADFDLRQGVEPEGFGETRQLLEALASMQAGLCDLARTLTTSSEAVAAGSAEIAAGSSDLSQRTEQTAARLQQTASSMNGLTQAVHHNADTAREAAALVGDTAEVAARGGDAMGRVVTTMEEIRQASQRIADITSVIDGIAFQTNILALNAAVEAARAGEQGRGFAVVAGEVRSLAKRAADAAHEIKHLIDDSVAKVEAGSAQVAEAGHTMEAINSQVRKATDLMQGMDAASQAQRSGIEAVDLAVREVDALTQQNAAMVEESSAAAERLRQQADRLAEVVHRFKLAP